MSMEASMKRILMAGAAALALTAAAVPAQAQWAVYDAKSDVSRIMEAVRALQQAQMQYQMLVSQYQQLQATYNSIAHATSLGDIAGSLGGITRSYLPYNEQLSAATSIMNGVGYGGTMQVLSGAERFLSANRVYSAPTTDNWTQDMQRRETGTANLQLMAQTAMWESDNRRENLARLQARLEAAQDGTEVEAVNGLIAIEQQNLMASQAKFQSIQAMMVADQRVTDQRREQEQRQQAENLRAATNVSLTDLR